MFASTNHSRLTFSDSAAGVPKMLLRGMLGVQTLNAILGVSKGDIRSLDKSSHKLPLGMPSAVLRQPRLRGRPDCKQLGDAGGRRA